MFTNFFTLLRANGLNISLGEWMSLQNALDKGMGCSGLSEFYFSRWFRRMTGVTPTEYRDSLRSAYIKH